MAGEDLVVDDFLDADVVVFAVDLFADARPTSVTARTAGWSAERTGAGDGVAAGFGVLDSPGIRKAPNRPPAFSANEASGLRRCISSDS